METREQYCLWKAVIATWCESLRRDGHFDNFFPDPRGFRIGLSSVILSKDLLDDVLILSELSDQIIRQAVFFLVELYICDTEV